MAHETDGMTRTELLMRAMEEDHAAITATSEPARLAHRQLAELMRRRAEEERDASS